MRSRDIASGSLVRFLVCAVFLLFVPISLSQADVIINVLAVNGKDEPQEKDIQFSLPGEIKPDDIVDTAGLQLEYNVKDAGYYLHGKVSLKPKETRTFRVKIRDIWSVSDEQVAEMKAEVERAYKEMGGERDPETAFKLRQKLLDKLDYIIEEQSQASGNVEGRIDTYRNHLQTLQSIRAKSQLIDYWRTDADVQVPDKVISYVINVENPGIKPKKVKQQHYLPKEVKPEYIVDRKGYEVRFDEKKGQPFLFKEDDFGAGEKRKVSIGIEDVWFVPENERKYVRNHAKYAIDNLQKSPFFETAKALYNDIVNNLDLIEALQAIQQSDIQQHIGAYRINAGRFEQAKKDLDALEKLLARFRADLEKSKIKNVMKKVQALKSLAKISEAIFDKKPTVNAAWTLIGGVMLFLAIFTIIHFVTWFLRSSKEKKQEEVKYGDKKDETQA